jgi:hypothetical protein
MDTLQVPRLDIRANIVENSFDEKERTIDVIASTGSRVKRRPFFSEPFVEELEVSSKAVRLKRFKNGAPVLMDHNHYAGIRGQLGVVEDARISNGKIHAKVRFSKREEFQPIINDIKDNIIRNISVGYDTHKIEEQERTTDGMRVLRAVDWEPAELSFVSIPADPDAQTRSENNKFIDCEFIERSKMENNTADQKGNENRSLEGGEEKKIETQVPKKIEKEIDLEAVRKEAIDLERKRVSQIREAVSHAGFEDKRADEFISNGVSVEQVRKVVLKELHEKDKNTSTTNIQVGDNLTQEGVKRGMTNAILHRVDPTKNKLDEQGNHYRNMKLLDLVRDNLQSKGVNARNYSPMELAGRGLHSTSDFPEILANVVNKTLRDAYQESPQTFSQFTRMVTVSDFKEISRTQLGDAPQLLEKLENGEYQSGTTSEAAEKYSVKEYGRIVPIGRRVIVNDDLNAFSRIPGMMGRQARNLESDLAWAEITSNPVMADGDALFSAAHGNLTTGPGTAISIASLGVGRSLMRLQTSLDGSKLNLAPSWLYVPVALETVADQFTSQIIPNTAGDVNPYGAAGRVPLRVGTEPRLDDDSSLSWYLMAQLAEIDMLEMAMLEGEQGPVTDSEVDFNTDGVKFKIRHTVGVKVIDHRGFYKNVGA